MKKKPGRPFNVKGKYQEYKRLAVLPKTYTTIKREAKKKNMLIIEYIDYLIERDKDARN